MTLAVLKFCKHPGAHEKEKIAEWLKARTGAKQLRDVYKRQIYEVAL